MKNKLTKHFYGNNNFDFKMVNNNFKYLKFIIKVEIIIITLLIKIRIYISLKTYKKTKFTFIILSKC